MYAKLEYVLTFIPQSLRRMYADDDTLLSYAFKALEALDIPNKDMMDNFDFFDVENHQINLPTGIEKIQAVFLYDGGLTADAIETLFGECEDCEEEDLNLNCMPIYHRIYQASPEIANHFTPVYYAGKVSNKILCKTSSCAENTFSMNNLMTKMKFSKASGVAAVFWQEHVKEDGSFLVTRKPIVLWQYMAAFIKMMVHEDMGNRMQYREYQQEMAAFLSEARGALNLRSMVFKAQKEIIYGSSQLLKVNQNLHNQYNQHGGI
jgi:hypothetical protein